MDEARRGGSSEVPTLNPAHHPPIGPFPVPRHLLALLSLLAVVAFGATAAACGADDVDPASVAEAAETTRGEGSARVRYDMKVSGLGLPSELALTGEGVTALDSTEMDLTFDLSSVLELAGASGDGATRILAAGGRLYVDPPAVEGLDLPGGKRWVGVDLARVVEAAGLDPEALGTFLTVTPQASLDALQAAGKLEEVGEEEVGGVATTRFKGEVAGKDLIAALPADQRDEAQKSLDELLAQSGQTDVATPVDVWVDEEGRVRRMRQVAKIPASKGVPAAQVTVSLAYSDFGTELDVQAPAEGETFDATGPAADALKGARP